MYTALFCKSCWPVNSAIRYFIQHCDMVFFQCDQPTANFKVISLLLNPTPLLKHDMSVDRPCCPINISRTFAGRTSDLVDCSPYKVDDTVDYNVTGTTAKVQTTVKRLHPVDLALFTQYLYFFLFDRHQTWSNGNPWDEEPLFYSQKSKTALDTLDKGRCCLLTILRNLFYIA